MPKRDFIFEQSADSVFGYEKKRKIAQVSAQKPANDLTEQKVNDDYTVGWICAITTEYVAAQAFLDEEHDQPEYVSPNDSNDYTLGKIGKHNVVIAVLPGGEYGIASAAIVARDMLHSFPNVRICLTVGIGGGAPSHKHDIRLGDVVVSEPRDRIGGVFQYDFGKTVQGQSFHITGFLNQPPTLLRTAMNGIKAQYKRKGHKLAEAITKILDKNPRLRPEFEPPSLESDKLFQSKIIHPINDDSACIDVCGKDPSQLIPRSERKQDEDNPAIHYGLIASANQVMKNALVRDALAQEKNVITEGITGKEVLCFEMEAAGLMNHFPCLVIRGICDYSDSHKNKNWQGYAAMTAAAYAKDLLNRIPQNRVECEKRIEDIILGVLPIISGTNVNVEMMKHKLGKDEDLKILSWLTPIDYAPRQRNFISLRQKGTGQWFLDSIEFQKWLEADNQTLFCPGIPGAGKTFITSIVIDYLQTEHTTSSIAYLYCNVGMQDDQTPEDLLKNILKQLVRKKSPLPDVLKNLYDKHNGKQSRPELKEILGVLQSIITSEAITFIVIDALDECQNHDRCRDILLSELFTLQAKTRLNIFATSRPQEVEATFSESIKREIIAIDNDIEAYLDDKISLWEKSHEGDLKNIRNLIKKEIIRAADGMFLLATLNMNALQSQETEGEIRDALGNLVKGENKLDLAYQHTMKRVQSQEESPKRLALRSLAWIFHANRPLLAAELLHALAVRPNQPRLDKSYLPNIKRLLSVCAGLVRYDEKSQGIDLIHKTIRDYFELTKETWFPGAESDIATVCATYLSFDSFQSGPCQTDSEFEERLRVNKLYDYAARNWGHHARIASTTCQGVVEFLQKQRHVTASVQGLMVHQLWPDHSGYSDDYVRELSGLHLAAYFGIYHAVQVLKSYSPNPKDSYGWTPLSWAAKNGHETVVQLLLNNGAMIEAEDDYGQTPLSWATKNGHETVVQILLNNGAMIEAKDGGGRTSLFMAAMNGHETVVQLLLNNGAMTEAKDCGGQTSLSIAAMNGHETAVQLLLSNGAMIEAEDDYGQTPLSWATKNGRETVVQLLLNNGAKVDVTNNYGMTPLSLANQNGHEAVVQLLLKHIG